MTHQRRRAAFTFTDLVIVLVLIAIAIPAAISALRCCNDGGYKVKCAANLATIYMGISSYTANNSGQFPRTVYQPGAAPTQYTSSNSAYPFVTGGPAPNDVTAAMFLLVRSGYVAIDVVVCPVTPLDPWDFDGQSYTNFSNFPGERFLGYSLTNPYPDGVRVKAIPTLDGPLANEFAIAGDMNPGIGPPNSDVTLPTVNSPVQVTKRANSRNHNQAGQNVLYGDGHVMFESTPFVGVQRDNVYTVSGSDDGSNPTSAVVVGPPRWDGDTVLLPVATKDPASLASSDGWRTAGLGATIAALLAAALAVALSLRRKADKPPVR